MCLITTNLIVVAGTKMSIWSFWSKNGVSYRLHYTMGPINTMGELASRVRMAQTWQGRPECFGGHMKTEIWRPLPPVAHHEAISAN